ncbi:MAG: hypothetical protein AAF170_14120 [Bacteroidota bacterium]
MPTTPSRDAARAAFDKLDTQEKSAFIFEATFNTIGQALEETGRRVADLFESVDVDDLFTQDADEETPTEAEPTSPPKKATSRKKPASRAKPKSTSKTAGKPKPNDDE